MTAPITEPDDPLDVLQGIDHIIYAVADLESGINKIENLLGVRPAIGGRHPDFGTHNALLSLGPATYLEIIAPDPNAPSPERGRLLGVSDQQESRLISWVLRSDSIQERIDAAAAAGVHLGSVDSGSRQAPDGTLLTWKLSDPYAMPFDGAVPFLIDWGNTPHPAQTAPNAGRLTALRINHPESEAVSKALSALGSDVEVRYADAFELTAIIELHDVFFELK